MADLNKLPQPAAPCLPAGVTDQHGKDTFIARFGTGGEVVNRIQIRDYSGDFEDVAELSRQVWTSEYSNKMWFPLWDAMFFRWQVGAQSGALCVRGRAQDAPGARRRA
jgi:hypothetical protein